MIDYLDLDRGSTISQIISISYTCNASLKVDSTGWGQYLIYCAKTNVIKLAGLEKNGPYLFFNILNYNTLMSATW